MRTLLLSLLALTCSLSASAKEERYSDDHTELHLTESAEKEVAQDRYKAILRIQEEGAFAKEIQATVNRKMKKAIDEVKALGDKVKVSTGSYNVNEKRDYKLNKSLGWQASQQIVLDSADKEMLMEIAGKLQSNGFVMENFSAYLSRKKQASYRTELIQEALKRIQDRAQQIAQTMGKKNVHIAAVNVDSNGYQPHPQPMFRAKAMMMAMDTMAESAPAAVVEGTEQRISINISVVVLLKD